MRLAGYSACALPTVPVLRACSMPRPIWPWQTASSELLMPFIPHTPADVQTMLEAIGVPSVETLFEEIPAALRIGTLEGVPSALNELQVLQLMAARAREDG